MLNNNNYNFIKMDSFPLVMSVILGFLLNMLNNLFFKKVCIWATSIILFFLMKKLNNFLLKLKEEVILSGETTLMKNNLNTLGFMFFITSEVMIFLSLFWSYIHNAYTPNQFVGNFWPPKGIEPSNPTGMIIFGTSILLSSSLMIMYCHSEVMSKNNKNKSSLYLIITLIMGLIFIDMQILEMSNFMLKLSFNFNDSIFSSSFLFITSLHASHVMFGMFGLVLALMLMMKNMNNKMMYLNLEFAIWYWHFVDYIWIVVFTLLYYLNN